ncbi:MAG: galactokinase [Gemmatimonadetes bacterium]|nr:galactokinase [Gemmatimonadota bacterium]
MSAGAAAELFRSAYGRDPDVVASAPGRVNLIGEHTDYNGGEVLPMAIDRRTWVALGREPGAVSRAVSREVGDAGSFTLATPQAAGAWWDYVHGALREVRTTVGDGGAWAVAVVSDVPAGAGLSSSAALEVATVLAAAHLTDPATPLAMPVVAQLAYRAEREFVGVPCGIMDQCASACATEGHALRIWCDSGRVAAVPFDRQVLVIDTAVPRSLRGSAFAERQAACVRALKTLQRHAPSLDVLAHASLAAIESLLDGEDRRRARHVVRESARVGEVVEALRTGQSLGPWLAASHASLRDDYACSSPELDWVVDAAVATPGVEGARLTGAGWGGCAIAIGEAEALEVLRARVMEDFPGRWGHPPRSWRTRASRGASIDA